MHAGVQIAIIHVFQLIIWASNISLGNTA